MLFVLTTPGKSDQLSFVRGKTETKTDRQHPHKKMNIPANPTSGRGTPVWVVTGYSDSRAIRSEGWLLSVDAATKRARVWVGSTLGSFPVGNISERTLTWSATATF